MSVADELPGLPPLDVVAAGAGMAQRHRRWAPCPVCGEHARSREDTRGPVGLSRGRDGRERWRCYRCDAGGDVVALLAAARFGGVPGRGDARWPDFLRELRELYGAPGATSRPGSTARPAPRTAPRPAPPPVYPPVDEVAALWAACGPTARGDVDVWAWLERRRALRCDALDALDLVRVMPTTIDHLPRWVPTLGAPELARRVYRLAVPMYDHAGALRSLRWRSVDRVRVPDRDRPDRLLWAPPPGVEDVTPAGMLVRVGDELRTWPKAAAARGDLAGLVLADPIGIALLQRSADVDPLAVGVAGLRWSGTAIVCEGEPDTWTRATAGRELPAVRERIVDTGRTFAVFGVVSGSWPEDERGRALADRIPDGARVILATHADPKGDAYARTIAATFAGRGVRLERAAPAPATTRGTSDA